MASQPNTYLEATIDPGKRRRQQANAKKASASSPPPAPSPSPTAVPTRRQTRSQGSPIHVANQTSSYFPQTNAVIDPVTGASLDYRKLSQGPDKAVWIQACANEIGRLGHGLKDSDIKGTNTLRFIKHSDLPTGRTATYLRIVATIRPQKTETHRVRFTVGGDKIDYPGDVSTPTADMTTAKLVFNSVLSTPNAKMACFDISNFYLKSEMDRKEYMRIPV